MNETLEQRALRIAKETDQYVLDHGGMTSENRDVEFARRLLAEQGEPVAEVYAESECDQYGSWMTGRHVVHTYKPVNEYPVGTKFYAAPPQDALDAKRYLDAIFAMADDGWLMHGEEGMSEVQEAIYKIAQEHPEYKRRAAMNKEEKK